MLSVPNHNKILLWLHGQKLYPLLKTVALQSLQQTLVSSRQRHSACIHYAMLLGEWEGFWRHGIFVFDMFTVDIQYCPHYIMDIAQYCPQLMDIAQYWPHTIDIPQYCPQNIQSILLNTVHRSFNDLTMHNKKQLHLIDTIQGVHKRMVRFQNLTRNIFLTLHWHNVHRQQRQLSQFLMC